MSASHLHSAEVVEAENTRLIEYAKIAKTQEVANAQANKIYLLELFDGVDAEEASDTQQNSRSEAEKEAKRAEALEDKLWKFAVNFENNQLAATILDESKQYADNIALHLKQYSADYANAIADLGNGVALAGRNQVEDVHGAQGDLIVASAAAENTYESSAADALVNAVSLINTLSGGIQWTAFAYNKALADQAFVTTSQTLRTQKATDDRLALDSYQLTVDGLKNTAHTLIQNSNTLAKGAERDAKYARDLAEAQSSYDFAVSEIAAAYDYLDALAQYDYDYSHSEAFADQKLALGFYNGQEYDQEDYDNEVGAARATQQQSIGQIRDTYSIAYADALGINDNALAGAYSSLSSSLSAINVDHTDRLSEADDDLTSGEADARKVYRDQLAANDKNYRIALADNYATELAAYFTGTTNGREQLALDLASANQVLANSVATADETYQIAVSGANQQWAADLSSAGRTYQLGNALNSQQSAVSLSLADNDQIVSGSQALNDWAVSGNYRPTNMPGSPTPGTIYLPGLANRLDDNWFRTMPGAYDTLTEMFSTSVHDASSDDDVLDEAYSDHDRQSDRQLTGGLVRKRDADSNLVFESTNAENEESEDDLNEVNESSESATATSPLTIYEDGDTGNVGDIVGEASLFDIGSYFFESIATGIYQNTFGPIISSAAVNLMGVLFLQEPQENETNESRSVTNFGKIHVTTDRNGNIVDVIGEISMPGQTSFTLEAANRIHEMMKDKGLDIFDYDDGDRVDLVFEIIKANDPRLAQFIESGSETPHRDWEIREGWQLGLGWGPFWLKPLGLDYRPEIQSLPSKWIDKTSDEKLIFYVPHNATVFETVEFIQNSFIDGTSFNKSYAYDLFLSPNNQDNEKALEQLKFELRNKAAAAAKHSETVLTTAFTIHPIGGGIVTIYYGTEAYDAWQDGDIERMRENRGKAVFHGAVTTLEVATLGAAKYGVTFVNKLGGNRTIQLTSKFITRFQRLNKADKKVVEEVLKSAHKSADFDTYFQVVKIVESGNWHGPNSRWLFTVAQAIARASDESYAFANRLRNLVPLKKDGTRQVLNRNNMPACTSVIFDARTGRMYHGISGAANKVTIHPKLQTKIDQIAVKAHEQDLVNPHFENWKFVTNCSEMSAINRALHDGADPGDLFINTLRPYGEHGPFPFKACENCGFVLDNLNISNFQRFWPN